MKRNEQIRRVLALRALAASAGNDKEAAVALKEAQKAQKLYKVTSEEIARVKDGDRRSVELDKTWVEPGLVILVLEMSKALGCSATASCRGIHVRGDAAGVVTREATRMRKKLEAAMPAEPENLGLFNGARKLHEVCGLFSRDVFLVLMVQGVNELTKDLRKRMEEQLEEQRRAADFAKKKASKGGGGGGGVPESEPPAPPAPVYGDPAAPPPTEEPPPEDAAFIHRIRHTEFLAKQLCLLDMSFVNMAMNVVSVGDWQECRTRMDDFEPAGLLEVSA